MSTTVRKYIELALRERISRERPDYPPTFVEQVVKSSMNGLNVSKAVLYRAIEIAAMEANGNGATK